MGLLKDFGSICGVVVTYHVGETFCGNIDSLIQQVDRVVIVDNNSCAETKKILKRISEKYQSKLEVIFNPNNLGLGHAQNQGIIAARHYDWILLLDHDSCLAPDMLQQMKLSYSRLSAAEAQKTAIIAPNIYDINSKQFSKYIVSTGKLSFKRDTCKLEQQKVQCAIASGSLIKASVIKKLGMLREDFFIDGIDIEFCLRVHKNNLQVVVMRDAILYHQLGEKVSYTLWGITVTPTNHTAERRYYIYRNRVTVCQEYGRFFPGYILFEIMASFNDLFRICLFEKNKVKKLWNIVCGIKAGIRG